MTFVSLADACRRLSIDTKTLHRWLAEAQLALQCHPHDGRKKGLSQEQLLMLASQHHRRLVCGEEPVPASLPSHLPALPADLLKLPEQLAAMQAQLATLQQQVADLTRLIAQHEREPASAAQPKSRTKPARASTRSTQSARPEAMAPAKTPSKPVHVIPRVEYNEQGRYVVICPKRGVLPIRPDTPEWFAWVKEQDSFRFVGKLGHGRAPIMSGASRKGLGGRIARSVTTATPCVWHPIRS